MESRGRLILALDLPERADAVALATALRNVIGMVKVGLEPFVAHGPDLVRELRDAGLEVFLDLKIHDIPRTAAASMREAAKLGVRLVTIHALGGAEMVRAAVEAADEGTDVIAVTLLTSMDEQTTAAVGIDGTVSSAAQRLGALAIDQGAHGLVCSAHELDQLSSVAGSRVVPGIRPAGVASGDQKRVATPAEAVRGGATWIVVGRPIVATSDPKAAAEKIVAELEQSEISA